MNMCFDYKLFKPSSALVNGTFVIAEQIPGYEWILFFLDQLKGTAGVGAPTHPIRPSLKLTSN